jgi:hypothetical protein
MKEMARRVPDAASYAPVTILVSERPDGVHLSFDSLASLIAPYGDEAALAVAMDLDAKVEVLLETAAGQVGTAWGADGQLVCRKYTESETRLICRRRA